MMKTTKLFQNGQSQAVRLPKEFRFEGSEVYIKKSGNVIILLPINVRSVKAFTTNLNAPLFVRLIAVYPTRILKKPKNNC